MKNSRRMVEGEEDTIVCVIIVSLAIVLGEESDHAATDNNLSPRNASR